MKRMLSLGIGLLAVTAALQFSEPGAVPASAATANVTVGDNTFTPGSITINVGDTVLWTWSGSNPHTVTSNTAEVFDSGAPQTTGTFSHQFAAAGTFAYLCSVHGTSMSGSVTVQLPASATNTAVPATNTPVGATSTAGATNTPSAATETAPTGTPTAVASVSVASPTQAAAAIAGTPVPARPASGAALPATGNAGSDAAGSHRTRALVLAASGLLLVALVGARVVRRR